MKRLFHALTLGSLLLLGCENAVESTGSPESNTNPRPETTAPEDKPTFEPIADELDIAEVRKALGVSRSSGQFIRSGNDLVAVDLRQTGVTDLTPLRGQPLRKLYLEDSLVTDLEPLRGMPLEELYLDGTKVTDLSPLKDAPIEKLSLNRMSLTDEGIASLATLTDLEIVWLQETPITDLTPLAKSSAISIDVEGSRVADLMPLAGNTKLQRLNIARTDVTDLRPLAGLKLTRLLFDVSEIEEGLRVIQLMPSLQELGPGFDRRLPPVQFWQAYAEELGKQ